MLRPLVSAGVEAAEDFFEASLAALAARRFCLEAERADMMMYEGVEWGGRKGEFQQKAEKKKDNCRMFFFLLEKQSYHVLTKSFFFFSFNTPEHWRCVPADSEKKKRKQL